MAKRAHVHYSGRVQGVGFRYSAREVACGYDVTGIVRNLPDGRVEMAVEGEPAEIEAFLEGIRASHLGGHIRGVDVNWADATGEYRGFDIGP